MENEKIILDPCCGSRMFWFDKTNQNVIFSDIRKNDFIACDGREINIDPDLIADFTNLPFEDKKFKLVVFDPPHDMYAGLNSFTAQKYGCLDKDNWENDIRDGFNECFRVLDDYGVLVFKWNELRVKVSKIIDIIGMTPLIGHKSGKANKTHWMCFMKIPTK